MKLKKNVKNKLIILGVISVSIFCIISGYFLYQNHKVRNAEVIVTPDQLKISMYFGESMQLTVQSKDSEHNENIEYKSYDKNVVSVDKDGKIVGLKPGKTQIEVGIRESVKRKKIDVEIKDHIYKIKKPKKITLEEDEQLQLVVYDEIDKKNYQDVEWMTSNKDIISVDSKGKISAKKVGKAKISIKKDEKVIDHLTLTVKKKEIRVKEIVISTGNSIQLSIGKNFQINSKVVPANATNKEIVYKSFNDKIASVTNKGIVKGNKVGETKITVSADKGKITQTIKIKVVSDNNSSANKKGPFITTSILKQAGIDYTNKLMVVAHPDDETLWGGGHLSEGNWFVVCLTNGYNRQRTKEYHNALNSLGAKGIILSYPDLTNGKRNNWSTVKNNIVNDMNTVLKYKEWNMIATHNPEGEYGHIHHKMTSSYMRASTQSAGNFSRLYYFGKFYKPNEIPTNLEANVSSYNQNKKRHALDLYTSQLKAINKKWAQLIPYEYWTKAG